MKVQVQESSSKRYVKTSKYISKNEPAFRIYRSSPALVFRERKMRVPLNLILDLELSMILELELEL
ncbi:MAG: hypothetical protein ACI8VT_003302, partial [Saprospiraceae bacterium]